VKVKLCRIWHLFHPYYITETLLFFILLFLSFDGLILALLSLSPEYILVSVFFGVLAVLSLWSLISRFPKELIVEKDEMIYCQKQRTSGFFRTKINCYLRYTKGNLKFAQNPLEKLFNVGHIIYEGEDYCECADYVVFKPYIFKKHRIYGIPDFSEFQKEFDEYAKTYK